MTAEQKISLSLGLKAILELNGVYDDVIQCMEEYAATHARQMAVDTASNVCKILKPEYMNSLFTWGQIEKAILASDTFTQSKEEGKG